MLAYRFPSTCRLLLGLSALGLLSAAAAPAAFAQSAKIFVSAKGNDANVGNSVSPKRTFQAAHDALAAGGSIVVLDTAGYGTLNITKGLTLTVPNGINASITVPAGPSAVTVNTSGADVVNLRGLTLEGGGTNGGNGILVDSVGILRVEDCTMRNFELGILMESSRTARMEIKGSDIHDTFECIRMFQSSSVVAQDAVVTDCQFSNASDTAVFAKGATSATNARITVSHCTVAHSLYGLGADVGGAINVDTCTVNSNGTGLFNFGTGKVVSFGANKFTDNSTHGSFTSTVAQE